MKRRRTTVFFPLSFLSCFFHPKIERKKIPLNKRLNQNGINKLSIVQSPGTNYVCLGCRRKKGLREHRFQPCRLTVQQCYCEAAHRRRNNHTHDAWRNAYSNVPIAFQSTDQPAITVNCLSASQASSTCLRHT